VWGGEASVGGSVRCFWGVNDHYDQSVRAAPTLLDVKWVARLASKKTM